MQGSRKYQFDIYASPSPIEIAVEDNMKLIEVGTKVQGAKLSAPVGCPGQSKSSKVYFLLLEAPGAKAGGFFISNQLGVYKVSSNIDSAFVRSVEIGA